MLVTQSTLAESLTKISKLPEVAIDVETTGLNIWTGDRVIGIAISTDREAWYFPFGHNEGYNLPPNVKETVYNVINKIPHLITFNGKFDLQAMYQDGFTRVHGWEDVMLAAHLMNENEESFALKRLADKYFGQGTSSDEAELTRQIKSRFGRSAKKGEIWRLPSNIVEPYACSDTLLTYRLRDFYRPHLERWSLSQLHDEVQQYNRILNQVEIHGVLIDTEYIHEVRKGIAPRMAELQHRINSAVGYEINVQSPKQLKEYFGTSSTAADILELLDDPVAQMVLDFRGLKKLDGTYFTSYESLMDRNNLIHASFNVHGTVAGRLSSSNPNLQNVPKEVRRAFIARPGHVIAELDYQAAEMRLAAHFTKSPRLVQIFRENGDPHQMVADEISEALGIPVSRQRGKMGNFGKIYGMGATGFARKFDSSYEEGKQFVDAYDTRFPEIKALYYALQKEAQDKGYIRLPTGRVRRYPDGKFQTAFNNLIQGTAAEVVRFAMTRLANKLPEAQMLLQVHDSILFELEEDKVESMIPEIVRIMEDFAFDPPMRVDVGIGNSWGTVESYD